MLNCMESNSMGHENPAAAQASLDAIIADRKKLASRTRAPAWSYPVLGIVTAVIVSSPAINDQGLRAAVIAGACAVFVFMEYAYKKSTGLSTNRIPGPRSLLVLIGMAVLVAGMLFVSALLATAGQQAWIVATAAIGFLTIFPGGLLYDRIYGAELRRGL